jgi:hypothetical protein
MIEISFNIVVIMELLLVMVSGFLPFSLFFCYSINVFCLNPVVEEVAVCIYLGDSLLE